MTILRRKALQIAALAAFSLPGLTQAQSAYTMSVLNKPLGSDIALPTSMDNQGVVRGSMYYIKRYVTSFGEGGCIPLFIVPMCPRHGQREMTWSARTSASVTGQAGLRGFASYLSNDRGSQLGEWDPDRSQRAREFYLWPGVLDLGPGSQPLNTVSSVDVLDLLTPDGAQRTVSPWQGAGFKPRAMNNSEAVVGTLHFAPAGAVVWRQGVLTQLPVPVPQNAESKAHDINDAGVIVGASNASETVNPYTGRPPLRPTRWVDDQPEFLGGPDLLNLEAIAVNNAGQVLIGSDGDSGYSSAVSLVWTQGVLTPLQTPTGQSVHPIAINDQGVVVGCTRVIKERSALTRADVTATVWRNGVAQELTQLLSSKGVKLPSGTRLGCPITINNQGSILAYYYKVSAPDTLTWVRFNAKP